MVDIYPPKGYNPVHMVAVLLSKGLISRRTGLVKRPTHYLISAVVATGAVLASVAVVNSETCTLKLKRRESNQRSYDRATYIYWATSSQRFRVQLGLDERVRGSMNVAQEESFKRIVKKEPKYESDQPLCRVAKLGSQEYAFVLDGAPPKSEAKDEKPDKEKDKADSATAELKKKLDEATPVLMAPSYDRLYFDFNHNGDLTDDEVIEAKVEHSSRPGNPPRSYARIEFPRIDVTERNVSFLVSPCDANDLLIGLRSVGTFRRYARQENRLFNPQRVIPPDKLFRGGVGLLPIQSARHQICQPRVHVNVDEHGFAICPFAIDM